MGISDSDSRMLWGLAAARCAEPSCDTELAPEGATGSKFLIGEMAHIYGREPTAPRYDAAVGADDTYNNRILLCPTHHTKVDKAPADFPVELLQMWKTDWEGKVRASFLRRSSVEEGSEIQSRLWSYFNFRTLLEHYANIVKGPLPEQFAALRAQGMVNDDGFPITGPNEDNLGTLFRTWPTEAAYRLMRFYSAMVESIVQAIPPVDVTDIWSVDRLPAVMDSGDIVFLNRGFGFKKIQDDGNGEIRRVQAKGGGVELTFQIDTFGMYSSSAVLVHYTGKSSAASLLWIRSVTPSDSGKKLEIKATPIALGTGFWK